MAAGPSPFQLLDGVAHDGRVTEEIWPVGESLVGMPPDQTEVTGESKSSLQRGGTEHEQGILS